MAIKPCRECGEDVSTEAETCPHCGTPSPTPESGARGLRVTFGAILVTAVLMYLLFWA